MTTLTVKRGYTWRFQVVCDDGATPTPTPIDLTGATITFSVKIDGATTIYTDGDGLTINYEDGEVDVVVEDAETDLYGADGLCWMDIEWPSEEIDQLFKAIVEVA